MKILNIGVLAHVDAGKTSLTERLLFNSGVIKTLGSVDQGNTQTDTMALERQRGITIKSAVTSFTVDENKINLLDTPGHPDFIAEVERVLSVLDGVILVVSAVEGVQAQTRILMKALQRMKVPVIIFVNKIDRVGARYNELLTEITKKLSSEAFALGTVARLGSKQADFLPSNEVGHSLTPVLFGSAITNAGIEALTSTISSHILPRVSEEAEEYRPAVGKAFKVELSKNGAKIAYVRMFSGEIHVRDQTKFGKVTALHIFEDGSEQPVESAVSGEIVKIFGLSGVKIGDSIGENTENVDQFHFAPPTLETVITAKDPAQMGQLRVALDQLVEIDPLINLRQDDHRQEISLSLYGEVQKEVIEDTLVNQYGVGAIFRETTTICVEKPIGSGFAVEYQPTSQVEAPIFDQKVNQFLATVGLKIEPGPPHSGVVFKVGNSALGKMPAAFYKAVGESVTQTLQQGIYGWQVTDCLVVMTNAGFWPRQSSSHGGFDKNMSSTARDFRQLTPLVVLEALKNAGVSVCEPIHSYRLEVPEASLSSIMPVLAQHFAPPISMTNIGDIHVLEGDIPIQYVRSFQQKLPGLTSGEGVLETKFSDYRPVTTKLPTRPRTDYNPLNRREYLINVLKKA